MHTMKRDTYRIKEEVQIGGTKEKYSAHYCGPKSLPGKLDTRIGEEVLLLQGEMLVFCFYESPDGRLDWIEQTVAYEGKIPCYGAKDSRHLTNCIRYLQMWQWNRAWTRKEK